LPPTVSVAPGGALQLVGGGVVVVVEEVDVEEVEVEEVEPVLVTVTVSVVVDVGTVNVVVAHCEVLVPEMV
jgi:hypothetical protein